MTVLLYTIAALYLGILTSISPCPLATNIAAMSYIGRRVGQPRLVMGAGVLYTTGRCLLYLLNQELRQRRPSRYEVRLLSRRERRFAILRRP